MNIIEFLMKNIYIVIAVLFVLSRVFSKSSTSKPPSSMPSFGGDDERSRMDPEPQSVQTYKEYSEESYPARERPSEPLYIAPPQDSRMERPTRSKLNSSTTQKAPVQSQTMQSASVKVDASKMRQAVIWSEILGQPRAKRPFRR